MSSGRLAQLDTLRQSWVFLLLGGGERAASGRASESELEYWEVGVGNADSFVQAKTAKVGSDGIESESDLIQALMAELGKYRYQGAILITPTRERLKKLRRRIVTSSKSKASLRGFTHIALEEQLEYYFGEKLDSYEFTRSPPRVTETDPEEVVSTGSAETFWEFWRRIFRLLPADTLAGEEL